MEQQKQSIGQLARTIARAGRGHYATVTVIGFPLPGVASNWTGQVQELMAKEQRARARAQKEYLAQFGAQVFLPGASGAVKLGGLGWAGAGIEPRREDYGILPPDIASLGTHTGGDITGAAGSKGKRARATGAGIDPQAARAQAFDNWQAAGAGAAAAMRAALSTDDKGAARELDATQRAQLAAMDSDVAELRDKRATIVQAIMAEQDLGKRILTLAGGRGYGQAGHTVQLNSSGMAARAARFMVAKSGKRKHPARGAAAAAREWARQVNSKDVAPSDTSLQDAAAAAAAAMALQWTGLEWLEAIGCQKAEWSTDTMIYLASMGWRAALHSLKDDRASGFIGRHAGDTQATGGAVATIDTIGAATGADIARCIWAGCEDTKALSLADKESLAQWAAAGGRTFDSEPIDDTQRARAQRRKLLSWFACVLDTKAGGRAGQAERARFSVLARLISGRDIATAAHGAGFATGRACLESFRSGKVWERLGAAIEQRVTDRDNRLSAARARAVKAAMQAIFVQRVTRRGARAIPVLSPTARRVIVASGASAIVASPFRRRGRVVHPAARRVIVATGARGRGHIHPLARIWTMATEQRALAVATARAARRAIQAARAQRLADFKAGTVNLRAGWLRT